MNARIIYQYVKLEVIVLTQWEAIRAPRVKQEIFLMCGPLSLIHHLVLNAVREVKKNLKPTYNNNIFLTNQ